MDLNSFIGSYEQQKEYLKEVLLGKPKLKDKSTSLMAS
jgi:hypothetical protein